VERFNELYKQFYPVLYRIVYRLTGNAMVAEDISQESFIKYYAALDKLPGGEQDRYWLIRVAKNLAFNYGRKVGREGRALVKIGASEPSSQKSYEEDYIALESKSEVQRALNKLPAKLREVLVLREYANFDYKQIASALKLSESNVKVRIFRGREQLAKLLKGGNDVS
jgi:RNA polymerase sigma-70 factor (ECF subfamily)